MHLAVSACVIQSFIHGLYACRPASLPVVGMLLCWSICLSTRQQIYRCICSTPQTKPLGRIMVRPSRLLRLQTPLQFNWIPTRALHNAAVLAAVVRVKLWQMQLWGSSAWSGYSWLSIKQCCSKCQGVQHATYPLLVLCCPPGTSCLLGSRPATTPSWFGHHDSRQRDAKGCILYVYLQTNIFCLNEKASCPQKIVF